MKKTFEVTLLNQKFSLKSDSDEKHVRKVSDYVNKKIFQVQEKTKSVSSLNVALLAALNIADDYYKLRSGKPSKNNDAQSKIRDMINFIDRCLEES